MMMMYGSTIFIIQVTAERVQDARLWYAPWLVSRPARLDGGARDQRHAHPLVPRPDRPRPAGRRLRRLAAEAEASPPGANGLLWLPYFSGERTPIHDRSEGRGLRAEPDPHARRPLPGASRRHRDGHGACDRDLPGGGAGAARVLAWAAARRTRSGCRRRRTMRACPRSCSEKTVGASYGDAFLAALAVGAVEPGDIARWNPVERVVAPGGAISTRGTTGCSGGSTSRRRTSRRHAAASPRAATSPCRATWRRRPSAPATCSSSRPGRASSPPSPRSCGSRATPGRRCCS
jgi:xylulokinase